MLNVVEIDDDRILQVFTWCQKSYRDAGYKLQFPKNTNPQKTYKWQHAKKLAQKLDEWEFDDDTSQVFIDEIAMYAKEYKLFNKGLSAFFQSNVLEVCHKRLEQSKKRAHSTTSSIERAHDFLLKQANGKPIHSCLVDRASLNSFFNLVTWYDTGKLPMIYLAVSKQCIKALARINKVDPEQRAMLPETAKLYVLHRQCVANYDFSTEAKNILGEDWR